jgi:glycosyltransferase involved in cell wall biosynthesis
MKIGMDAKWFFQGPPSGRIVVQNLVKQMVLAPGEHELYLFLDQKEADKPFPYLSDRVHLVYVWGGNNLLSNLLVIPLIAFKLKLDLVIFQNFAPLISNFSRYSYVHCVLFKSNPEYFTLKERLYFAPLKLTVLLSHGICTVSQAEKSRMVSYGYGSAANIDVIYHGIDERFRPREMHNEADLEEIRRKYQLPETFLLYVGRLNVVKNISNLIKALPHLKEKVPLVIVGDYDWKMTRLDTLVKELALEGQILFTGAVYGEDLPLIYALSSIFCFPSYEESFGLPAVEAMASGVPVVLSNRSSLPEIGGDAGSYIDPDAPEDIAAKIGALLADASLRERKRQLGLQRAQQFNWEISARELMEHALRVCGRGKP